MNERLGGLVIVVLALLFLWLYDTGRWSAITTAINGPNSAGQTPAQSVFGGIGSLGSLFGGSSTPTNGVSGAPYETQLFCTQWPTACPYNNTAAATPAKSGGGGGNTLSTIVSLGATIAGLFA